MKAILGVDANDAFRPAVCLLSRLHPVRREVKLVHAADISLPWTGLYGEAQVQADYTRAMENVGRRALDRAVDDACLHDFMPKSKLIFGSAAATLIHESEAPDIDLVAVNATHKGAWSSAFMGSVSRALAIGCPKSVLIAKGDRKMHSPLRVVFGTDHSDYCNRALDRFLSWKLNGIGAIEVVSAYQLDPYQLEITSNGVQATEALVDQFMQTKIEERNQEVVTKLQAAGYSATSKVVHGAATDALRQAMQEFEADILVVAAQGHGFWQRLMVGSVALHQVVAEPYPVLILRA